MKFVNTGLDQSVTNSYLANRTKEEAENLSKGIDKAKLVQVETTVNGKNGTFTRKQWKKAGDVDPKKDHVVGDEQPTDSSPKKEEKKAPSNITFECSDGNTKGAMAQLLVDGHSRDDIMTAAKSQGITWEEKDHPAINWMRCSMAIQKHMKTNSGNKEQPTEEQKTTEPESKEQNKPKKEETSSLDRFRDLAADDDVVDELAKIGEDLGIDTSKDPTEADAKRILDKYDASKDSKSKKEETPKKENLTKVQQECLDKISESDLSDDTKKVLEDGIKDKHMVLLSKDGEYKTAKDWDEADYAEKKGWKNEGSLVDRVKEGISNPSSADQSSESVIGKDYKKLTTEKEADTVEGEAHNMIVGRLKSEGHKNPTDFQVKSAAFDLAKKHIRSNLVSGNSRDRELGEHLVKISGGVPTTTIIKDIAQDRTETKEARAQAFKELAGDSYYVDRDNSIKTVADTGGKYQTEVKIVPTSGGKWSVEFSYSDGKSYTETYDSFMSTKTAADRFMKNETERGKQQSTVKVAKSVIEGNHSVKAKTEEAAISKINKQLKEEGLAGKEEGSFYKVVKDKGYMGKYTLTKVQAFKIGGKVKTKSDGSSQGSFNLTDNGNGEFSVKRYSGSGYNGQD